MERLRKKTVFTTISNNSRYNIIKSYNRNVTEYGTMKFQLCVLNCPT